MSARLWSKTQNTVVPRSFQFFPFRAHTVKTETASRRFKGEFLGKKKRSMTMLEERVPPDA